MKASELYASPFLKAADLSKPARVRIIHIEEGNFTDQKTGKEQKRLIIHFDRGSKGLVLNKTQAGTLIAAAGDDTERWRGVEVVLSPAISHTGQPTIGLAVLPIEPHQEDEDAPF